MSRLGGEKVEVLLSEAQLAARIAELGARISADYAGQPLTLVGVLKGSFMFLADLARAIDLPLKVDFIGTTSYQGTKSSGVVRITNDLSRPIDGEHILLVEDIVDTGLTMQYLLENLATRHPASVKVCALLEKPARAKVQVPIAYKGFSIPDEFVIGYGLDWDGRFRNLPFLGVVKP
ncbi:hypoxanthine phosphoribosyltransferase [Anaeromyxobacter diazotrophicus]|uniref:Hypoxanthine phosphoribosyltransferase n=1 Tax=Anaeromyxobacter diazotrophicus TaxID=2590199 RepID=A0A7I9VRE5_9BACT|nr:hypoxanthine phosphoribosyltransferase [Anaeromyxobacter diazotrophicus]GEJ58649.1 hypoxanthine phosphoribosyltransferase [Anaeromyxobacter diazotrophicus]